MNRRAALLLLFLLPGGAARADIADLHRPILAVWSAEAGPNGTSWCGHCDKFWRDYRENERFRASLDRVFRVTYVNADRRKLEGTLLRGIVSLPTFDSQYGRVKGYTNPEDLLERLGVAWVEPYRRAEPSAGHDLPALPPPLGTGGPAITEQNQPAADSQSQEPEQSTPQVQPATPQGPTEQETPSPAAGSQSGDASTPVAPQSGGSWIGSAASTAAGILWGPAGAAAVSIGTGVLGWFAARRKKRQATPVPQSPANESPAEVSVPATNCLACKAYRDRISLLNRQFEEERAKFTGEIERIGKELEAASVAEGKQTETRFVRVPVSDEAGEAYREAIRRVAELNPRAVSLLNQLESTAAQLLHGAKAKRGDAPPESKPGLWSDLED